MPPKPIPATKTAPPRTPPTFKRELIARPLLPVCDAPADVSVVLVVTVSELISVAVLSTDDRLLTAEEYAEVVSERADDPDPDDAGGDVAWVIGMVVKDVTGGERGGTENMEVPVPVAVVAAESCVRVSRQFEFELSGVYGM